MLAIYLDVLITSWVYNRKDMYLFYRIIDAFSVIVVEEIYQRSVMKFDLTLNASAISSLHYQFAHLMAHSAFFWVWYLLLYLVLKFPEEYLFGFSFD